MRDEWKQAERHHKAEGVASKGVADQAEAPRPGALSEPPGKSREEE